MRLSHLFVIASFLAVCTQARAQTLIYSVSYADTRASLQARFPNLSLFPSQRSEEENLALLRNTRKNDIYSVSVADGKHSLVFSDAGMNLEIRAFAEVSPTGKAYTSGVWRERRGAPTPGFYSDEGIYELSLDGSNHFRKIADDQKQGRPVLNAQGTKAVFVGWENDKFAAHIYALPEWKLLTSWDFGKLLQTHCPACSPTSYGWMADGNRLYVSMVVAGEEDDDSAKADHPGTYILSDDGTDLGALPANIGAFQVAGYIHPNFIERQFQGQLSDGRYLFLDHGVKQGKSPRQTEHFLVIAGADGKLQKILPLKFPIGGYTSPSGKFLVYLESRITPNYRSEPHLWVKNLETGEEKELFSAPPPGPPNSPEPNQSIFILGWIN
jgi:hypothetical protein